MIIIGLLDSTLEEGLGIRTARTDGGWKLGALRGIPTNTHTENRRAASQRPLHPPAPRRKQVPRPQCTDEKLNLSSKQLQIIGHIPLLVPALHSVDAQAAVDETTATTRAGKRDRRGFIPVVNIELLCCVLVARAQCR